MAAVAEREKELYPDGLADEIMLWYSEITRRLHHVVPSEMHPAFAKWRDSRGTQVNFLFPLVSLSTYFRFSFLFLLLFVLTSQLNYFNRILWIAMQLSFWQNRERKVIT